MKEAGFDDRLGALNRKVDEGFRRIDADVRALRTETRTEFRELRSEMNERFDRLEGKFDSKLDGMQRTLVLFCGGIIAALIGMIATQL